MGIKDTPREEIPWYPTIDDEECTACGTCVEFCSHGTYEWDEEDKPAVSNPYNCVVGCTGCLTECPVGAISFPSLSILKKFM